MAQEQLRQTPSNEKRLLKIGDVFGSPLLAHGYRDYNDRTPIITIDGRPEAHVITMIRSETERIEHAAQTGEILPRYYEVEYAAHDPVRALAHFVVTRTEHPYGHRGSGGMSEGSPEEHIVWAQRLAEDETFDPEGEQIKFNQMGWGHNITPEDVVILRMMQQRFV